MELPALPPAPEWRRCVLGAAEGPAATLFHGALVSPRCENVTRPCAGPVCPHSGYLSVPTVAIQCVVYGVVPLHNIMLLF